ncbi:MAG: hypothetical protein Q7R33_07475 [Nitrosarchaeum sp.]|nr:hypothetical protein [Nitrosarchaeum sp.]
MNIVEINVDIKQIVPPKWYYIFLPWKWDHLRKYRKRTLKAVWTMEQPREIKNVTTTNN